MSPEEPHHPKLSARDKLERLQTQLREVRARSAALSQEKAELLSQTSTLEKEMNTLRRAQELTQSELQHLPHSLPEPFMPFLFQVSPAVRTGYGRWRTALKLLPRSVFRCALMGLALLVNPRIFWLGGGALIAAHLVLLLLYPVPEDADAFTHWAFDREGFFPCDKGPNGGKVLYREIREVRVSQGPLQRLAGVGTVSVTWAPAVPTTPGSSAGVPLRVVKLKLIEAPEQLAAWLRERVPAASGSEGAVHVG